VPKLRLFYDEPKCHNAFSTRAAMRAANAEMRSLYAMGESRPGAAALGASSSPGQENLNPIRIGRDCNYRPAACGGSADQFPACLLSFRGLPRNLAGSFGRALGRSSNSLTNISFPPGLLNRYGA
jgi:hypothetical protein